MKKLLAILLCCIMVLSFSACSKNNIENTESVDSTTATEVDKITITDEKIEEIEKELNNFEGIFYLTHNGELVYSQAKGEDESRNKLTIDTPMYIGSISKQFCATAIMILKEQNKLSVDDTLDKYFPEYQYAKDITIKNLLTMRSGIPNIFPSLEGYSPDKTESENMDILKNWAFEQPLNFEPDTNNEYSNTNYTLLSYIVEMVSGQHYNDFVRENIFEPLEMDKSGFVSEVDDSDFYSAYLTYDSFTADEDSDGICKGAGDIVATAPDMEKWMSGLSSGKIISKDSYSEMTQNYSPDTPVKYGYGLKGFYKKGIGHTGTIGNYVAIDYMHNQYGCNLFAVTTQSQEKINTMPMVIMDILIKQ